MHSEEIDAAFWNNPPEKGFYFLPNIILVECKNWSRPLGSAEVSWFDTKLRTRGQPIGILVAIRGITGDADSRMAAHEIIARALFEGRKLIVITLDEIAALTDSLGLVELIQEKLTSLVVMGTSIP